MPGTLPHNGSELSVFKIGLILEWKNDTITRNLTRHPSSENPNEDPEFEKFYVEEFRTVNKI